MMEAILTSSAITVQQGVLVDESHLSVTARTLKTNRKKKKKKRKWGYELCFIITYCHL